MPALSFDRGRRLLNFLQREAVTIAALFSALMLLISNAMPSLFHSALFVAGLGAMWMAILMTGVNRL